MSLLKEQQIHDIMSLVAVGDIQNEHDIKALAESALSANADDPEPELLESIALNRELYEDSCETVRQCQIELNKEPLFTADSMLARYKSLNFWEHTNIVSLIFYAGLCLAFSWYEGVVVYNLILNVSGWSIVDDPVLGHHVAIGFCFNAFTFGMGCKFFHKELQIELFRRKFRKILSISAIIVGLVFLILLSLNIGSEMSSTVSLADLEEEGSFAESWMQFFQVLGSSLIASLSAMHFIEIWKTIPTTAKANPYHSEKTKTLEKHLERSRGYLRLVTQSESELRQWYAIKARACEILRNRWYAYLQELDELENNRQLEIKVNNEITKLKLEKYG